MNSFVRTCVMLVVVAAPFRAAAQVPSTVNFTARLVDNGTPVTGNHNLSFALFDAPTGGIQVWTETHAAMPVSDGLVYVDLGSAAPLTTDVLSGAELYLQVSVDSTPLDPRIPLGSAPYAVRAGVAASAEKIGNLAAADLITGVYAGTGLSSSAAAGGVTLEVNFEAVQARVSTPCNAGTAIRAISSTGSVTCEPIPASTSYSAGTGLVLDNGQFTADVAFFDALYLRKADAAGVYLTKAEADLAYLSSAACLDGQVLKFDLAQDAWVCAADANAGGDLTDVLAAAGGGLAVTNGAGPQPSVGLVRSCNGGQVLKWDGAAWNCADDVDTNGGGDVTDVLATAGGGLAVLNGSGPQPSLGLVRSCASGQVLKWSALQWDCAPDANSGGTVTQVNSGAGLSGGPFSTTGTLSIANSGVTNAMLQNNSITVNAGTGMVGGGTAALGGALTLGLSSPVSIANGGTGSATQNFVDLTTDQTIAGTKTFTGPLRATSTVATSGSSAIAGVKTGGGSVYGVAGQVSGALTNNAAGVVGFALGTTGSIYGVVGESDSAQGVGVYGYNAAVGGVGVQGSSQEVGATGSNIGVVGIANGNTNAAGGNTGVAGQTSSNNGVGVSGLAGGGTGGVGVLGANISTVGGAGTHYGVFGQVTGTQGSAGSTHIAVTGIASGGSTNVAGNFGGGGELLVPASNTVSVAPTRNYNGSLALGWTGATATSGRIYWAAGGYSWYVNSTGQGDYSEYFRTQDDTLAIGEVVALDPEFSKGVRRARPRDASSTVGVVSESGTRNNDDGQGMRHLDPGYVNVGLLGQVPVLVSLENGPIAPGDPLTLSPVWRGRVVKALGRARIIGFATTHFPYAAGEAPRAEDVTAAEAQDLQADHVMCFLEPGWYEPPTSQEDGMEPPLEESARAAYARSVKQATDRHERSPLTRNQRALDASAKAMGR